jgi:hypothetical protein
MRRPRRADRWMASARNIPSDGVTRSIGRSRWAGPSDLPDRLGQRVADSSNDIVPRALLGCGVIQRHTVHIQSDKVASVVPNIASMKAGYDEKIGTDPAVNSRGLGQPEVFLEKFGRGVRVGVPTRLYHQVRAAIFCSKAVAIAIVRIAGIVAEYLTWNLDRRTRFRYDILFPAGGSERQCWRGRYAKSS